MSIGKFAAGTTLATPAIGGMSYVTYEELTKEKPTEEISQVVSATTEDGGTKETVKNQEQKGENGKNITDPQSSSNTVEDQKAKDESSGKGSISKSQLESERDDESYDEGILSPGG